MQDVLNPRSRVFFRAYSVYRIAAANFNLSPRYLYPQALLPFLLYFFSPCLFVIAVFFGLPFSISEGSRGRDCLVVLPSLCLLVLLVLVSWCMCRSGLYLY